MYMGEGGGGGGGGNIVSGQAGKRGGASHCQQLVDLTTPLCLL